MYSTPINQKSTQTNHINDIHHHEDHHPSESGTFLSVLEKISAVALGAFAAYTNLELFVPFFLFGVAVGIYDKFVNQDQCQSGHSASCCLGFLEKLTGARLPPFFL